MRRGICMLRDHHPGQLAFPISASMDVLLVEANSTLKSTSTCRFKNVYDLTHLTRQPEGFGLWIMV